MIYPSQLVSTARMLTGALARLSDPDGQFNLAVFPDDVVYYATSVGGTRYRTDHFVIGEPARSASTSTRSGRTSPPT